MCLGMGVFRGTVVKVWPEKLPFLSGNILGGGVGWGGVEEGPSRRSGLILNPY